MSLAAERVAKGAAWLDRVQPGWENRIVLPELNLSSMCNCVCGQVFAPVASSFREDSGFSVASNVYGLGKDDKGDEMSLSVQFGFDRSDDMSHDELQGEWEKEINKRLKS